MQPLWKQYCTRFSFLQQMKYYHISHYFLYGNVVITRRPFKWSLITQCMKSTKCIWNKYIHDGILNVCLDEWWSEIAMVYTSSKQTHVLNWNMKYYEPSSFFCALYIIHDYAIKNLLHGCELWWEWKCNDIVVMWQTGFVVKLAKKVCHLTTFLILSYLSHMTEVCHMFMTGACWPCCLLFIFEIVSHLLIPTKNPTMTTSFHSQSSEDKPQKIITTAEMATDSAVNHTSLNEKNCSINELFDWLQVVTVLFCLLFRWFFMFY